MLLAAGVAVARSATADNGAHACPAGYLTRHEQETLRRAEQRREGGSARRAAEAPILTCAPRSHPEDFAEFMAAKSFQESRALAPHTSADPAAYGRAVRARQALIRADAAQADKGGLGVAGSAGTWKATGHGPLLSSEPGYEEVKFGFRKLNGRVADFAYDAAGGRLFAAVANGGVWTSDNLGQSWTDIARQLPTQIVGSLEWLPAKGSRKGTIVALTGDNAFGGYTYPGAGVFWSDDLGKTWTRADGVPDGALGFKAAVDPTNSDVVWLATGLGLYRSTDAGRTFSQVTLPTGDCAGRSLTKKGCFFANVVTDVVVQPKDTFGHPGGRVLAAVGYRAGTRTNPDGTVQAPSNGIYTNTVQSPTAFTKQDVNSFVVPERPQVSAQDSIGRIELGIANGTGQNADYVYAVVQDANLFNHNSILGIDAPEVRDPEFGGNVIGKRTVLNGIYVTSNFGQSWTQMANGDTLQSPGKNSALVGLFNAAVQYGPGVQAWYDQFIDVDPTRQVGGVPTRVTFGLEEVWQNTSAQGNPGTPQNGPSDFTVIGRYFSGQTCQALTLPASICPTSNPPVQGTTTHPDQHAAIEIPQKDGGLALVIGDDGGVFVQKVGPGEAMSNDKWGDGANDGFYTLLPYDVHMAKDGTVYSGLQDNGQLKIQPDGKQIAVQGGDGFYSAVDPDNSNVEYGEVAGGTMYRSVDGGKTSTFIDPELTQGGFVTPFAMDPNDAKHLLVAGREVKETVFGPETQSPSSGAPNSWKTVYDLGTRTQRGVAGAAAATGDPNNSASAIALRGAPAVPAKTGPVTPNVSYTGGDGTVPGGGNGVVPGTYDEHEFTIKPGDVDRTATITVSWNDPTNDWDLVVLRKEADGSETQVGSSGNADTTSETVQLTNPQPATYVIHVDNYTAQGTFKGTVAFEGVPPGATQGAGTSYAYVGFCGYCDPLTEGQPFDTGIATNVTSLEPNPNMSNEGWHIPKAKGLPKRTITDIEIDADDPRTIFVTVGGYQVRPYAPPGVLGDDTSRLGQGHLFVSNDAGDTFRDVSGELPDIPATSVVIRRGQPVVATNVGVFVGEDLKGGHFTVLGSDLPASPVFNLNSKPDDGELLLAASFGRGVQSYRYKDPAGALPTPGIVPNRAQRKSALACLAASGFRFARVRPRRHGARLQFARRVRRPVTVEVFQTSRGRTVLGERRIAVFRNRSTSFTWNGRANVRRRRATDGYYFVRYSMRVKGSRRDLRRIVLRRRNGRYSVRPSYYRRETCGVLSSYKLERPVFGGPRNGALIISYRLARPATIRVLVTRGKKTLKVFATRTARAGRTYRLRFDSEKRARGDYKVRLQLRRGSRRQTATLTSRRL